MHRQIMLQVIKTHLGCTFVVHSACVVLVHLVEKLDCQLAVIAADGLSVYILSPL